MEIEERNFTSEEAKMADEAFISSASTFVMPVVKIEGEIIGNGKPGAVSKRLREIYIDESRKRAI
jgi:D-alanine transaminase